MTARLIAALRSPACYPHPAGTVELLETHISWVLLAGDFAYKVKKPVSLGFVDFSTLGKRRHFCEEELRVNLRTAPQLYLEVVPITGTESAPVVGGAGPAIEYAVRMRRFPQEALLDREARRGALTAAQVDALAQNVAQFHANVECAKDKGRLGSPAEILAEALGNFTQVEALDHAPADRARVEALRQWTQRAFEALRETFARRRRDGFVRECHGDLHLGNVALIDGEPVAFDAVEFSEALRWIDVMNDVAFTVMDLLHHGLPRLAWRFLDAWLAASGDYAGIAVLRFYLVYRAMVRAKVACIRARQPGVTAADRARSMRVFQGFLARAERLAQPGHPALVAMHGLSGSGKTTVSQALLESAGAIRVRSDVERKRMHGLPADARTHANPGAGIYAPAADAATYSRLAALSGAILAAGWPVIVDASFLERARRDAFRDLAKRCRVPFLLVACVAPAQDLRARLEKRAREDWDASEAGIAVLARQTARAEPLGEGELGDAESIDTATGKAAPERAINAISGHLQPGTR